MAIQSVSGFNSSLSNTSKVNFSSNETGDYTDKKELVQKKREEADKIVKNVYRKGYFAGAVITAVLLSCGAAIEYYLIKHFDKKYEKDIMKTIENHLKV